MNIFIDLGNPICCGCNITIDGQAYECVCGLAMCKECNDNKTSCKTIRCAHCDKILKPEDDQFKCHCGKVHCILCRDGGGCWECSPDVVVCKCCGNEYSSDDSEECQDCGDMFCPNCINDGQCKECIENDKREDEDNG